MRLFSKTDSDGNSDKTISAPVRALVDLTENRYQIAGHRFGLDALIGLVPGIGDFVGALLGAVVIVEAFRLGASWPLIGRMLFNLWLDGVLGSLPVVGDVFDFYFRANRRNLKLLEKFADGG